MSLERGAGMDPDFLEVPDSAAFCCRPDKKNHNVCNSSHHYYSWMPDVNVADSWCAARSRHDGVAVISRLTDRLTLASRMLLLTAPVCGDYALTQRQSMSW
jgi:hypothetical protein